MLPNNAISQDDPPTTASPDKGGDRDTNAKTRRRTPRISDAEREQRISTVLSMLAVGTRRHEILQFTATKWGIREREANAYIAAANKIIAAEAAKPRDAIFAKYLANQRDLAALARNSNDLELETEILLDAAQVLQQCLNEALVSALPSDEATHCQKLRTALEMAQGNPEKLREILRLQTQRFTLAAEFNKILSGLPHPISDPTRRSGQDDAPSVELRKTDGESHRQRT